MNDRWWDDSLKVGLWPNTIQPTFTRSLSLVSSRPVTEFSSSWDGQLTSEFVPLINLLLLNASGPCEVEGFLAEPVPRLAQRLIS